jgi:hypothetical protein
MTVFKLRFFHAFIHSSSTVYVHFVCTDYETDLAICHTGLSGCGIYCRVYEAMAAEAAIKKLTPNESNKNQYRVTPAFLCLKFGKRCGWIFNLDSGARF